MRQAFTLIELMIVIAIIAIIAAIAIPNLLESRVTSQENAAAAALKSGILPAEVQFQAGGYLDNNNNGLGEYITGGNAYDVMSGGTATTSNITLNLLAPTYRGSNPQVSGYVFKNPQQDTNIPEQCWAVGTRPVDNNQGRRQFVINQAGNIYAIAPTNTASTDFTCLGTTVFGASCTGVPDSTVWKAYRR